MLEKFKTLSKEHQKTLVRLSIFGNEETSIPAIIKLFRLDDFEEDKNEFLNIIYDLNSEGWISIEKDKYIVKPEVLNFILEENKPDVKNSRFLIETFINIFNPEYQSVIKKETEIFLLKALGKITGNSEPLALLNDYYAQYLNIVEDHKSAANFFELAVDIQANVNPDSVKLCNYYNHLSETYMLLKDYDKALNMAFKASHLAYKLPQKDLIVLVYSYTLTSSIYYSQRKYELSFQNILKAIEFGESHKLDKHRLATLYYETSLAATKAKKLEEAQTYIIKANNTAKLLDNNNEKKKLQERIMLQQQYVALQKKLNNTILKFSKTKYLLIVALIIVLIIVLAFIIL